MSYQRQVIGNRGIIPHMHKSHRPSHPVHTRSLAQGAGYPGTYPDYTGYPGLGQSQFPVQSPITPEPASGSGGGLSTLFGGGGSSAASTGSGINIGQLKGIVDRLGGVEGIVDTFGKMQKMVQSVNQMAPMLKLLMGAFGKKKSDDASEGLVSPGRRRRRKRKGSVRGQRRTRR
ncbi:MULTISPECIES: hypothetical protein [unclassified Paenibacillus]|uniref:hypothetical protein n=1 Tax=unclassified Paenibacillus TaxID=185978 RepID=UPI001AE8FD03|nr:MULTISPECIES: hypothetical protein [unclassified Paenibacillus]MBP1153920.1 hypothetical protein [Paenibacillus sp. PvP091]MBP1170695.1 hypothetical protein [Paenibacillus sp. PvR098]MBP2441723.1 hypothetical protein [Paenibacillus sp. PvP052]